MTSTLILGDCLEVLPTLEEGSVDAVCTDPPYGLEFMGKGWDRLGDDAVSRSWDSRGRRENVPQKSPERPGSRHAVKYKQQNPRCRKCGRAVQGRDTAKGFKVCGCEQPDPYMPNIYPVRMQEWHQHWAEAVLRVLKPSGYMLAFGGTRTYHRLACAVEDAGFEVRDCLMWVYGTGFPKGQGNLKPAWEPILLCRKPGKGVLPLGIDECRIPGLRPTCTGTGFKTGRYCGTAGKGETTMDGVLSESHPAGRYPANLVHDGSDEVMEAFAAFGESKSKRSMRGVGWTASPVNGAGRPDYDTERGHDDEGTPARFFYCAKASRKERGEGNTHPTVKPLALMEWLVKLVCPPGGVCLDPFLGSGTTAVACLKTGRSFIGVEREPEYVAIAERRIAEAKREAALPLLEGIHE